MNLMIECYNPKCPSKNRPFSAAELRTESCPFCGGCTLGVVENTGGKIVPKKPYRSDLERSR